MIIEYVLDATLLTRTATVVRKWRYVFDRLDLEASRFEGGDRTFAATAGTLYLDFHITQPKFLRLLRRLLGSTLTRERGTLTASLETTRARTGPAERVTLGVRNRHHRVVERRGNKSDASRNVTAGTTTRF